MKIVSTYPKSCRHENPIGEKTWFMSVACVSRPSLQMDRQMGKSKAHLDNLPRPHQDKEASTVAGWSKARITYKNGLQN